MLFRLFSVELAVFRISQRGSRSNQIFENYKIWKILSLFPSQFYVHRQKVPVRGNDTYSPGNPLNVTVERITPSCLQVLIQCSIINLKIASENKIYPSNLTSPRVLKDTALNLTAFQHFDKICIMTSFLDKFLFCLLT